MAKYSKVILSLAERFAAQTKGALWLWSRFYISARRGHTFKRIPAIDKLANAAGYRIPVRAKLGNGLNVVVPWNDDIGHSIYQHGYYERDTVLLIEKLLRPGMVFFDIGANIGQYSLVASKSVGSAGEVHSFEPDPITFRWLVRNVRLNNLTTVRTNQIALFNEVATKTLHLATPTDTGSNSFVMPWNFSGRTCEVTCTTLDEYQKTRDRHRIDVIKLDVEGAELFVLQGATSIWASQHKPVLIIEFEEETQQKSGASCGHLARFLESKGYTLYQADTKPLVGYSPGPDCPATLNVIAVPTDRIATILPMLN